MRPWRLGKGEAADEGSGTVEMQEKREERSLRRGGEEEEECEVEETDGSGSGMMMM